ncbi:PEP-CTERM protein-sorting domain-containing protein [Duganella sp. CF402]|uniref:PEP-CTERM sorting domain-containing protein n=1 Tax=unclassified Duganella TaxID=2636909 RepID=UPI0008BD50C5|nr:MULTISPECIES: PEP-CTERM sorting domain-containing protein [unclassified Duganella]RZT08593.1 putative secreted protein with PEP-CTERM sorting signal [Duganella sp. BK701]SEL88630.1 PEP-CTERM protein-sorting domain-containing protein [Duganella sp. CF402]
MKVVSLISSALLALSFAGAVQAKPAAPATDSNVAPATIVLAHCEANDPAPCGISNTPSAAKASDADQNTLSTADPKQQTQAEPATPVPEPQTFVMLMLGLVVLGFASRRRQGSEKFTDE